MATDVYLGRLRVRRVTLAELDTCLRLRRIVFIDGQAVPEHEEIDGRDPEALHFLAEWRVDTDGYVDDGWQPVGTARVRTVHDDQGRAVAKAERVAVLPEYRGKGVGRALMKDLETDARRRGHVAVKLASQEEAVPFYLELGYRRFGERFMDAGIPHYWMDKVFADCPS